MTHVDRAHEQAWRTGFAATVLAAIMAVFAMTCSARRPPREAPSSVASSRKTADSRPACGDTLAVQVLGSGGPIADDARASTGYVVWVDGRSRALIDAGGGVFQRFGQAGARIEDLEVIALTHLHADHSADVAALFKAGYFTARQAALPVLGPTGNRRFPAMDEFVEVLLSPEHGAYRYLSGYLTGERGWFQLSPTALDATSRAPVQALSTTSLEITAVGVEHGSSPALGYVFAVRGKRIGFAGDQSGNNPAFVEMARHVDLLIMHHAIPENAGPAIQQLHATPSQIGRAAAEVSARRLVLSHHMRRALDRIDEGLAAIRASYDGRIDIAEDLDCYEISHPSRRR